MRVWVVDDISSGGANNLERLVRDLATRPDCDLEVVGSSGFQPDFVDAMRKLVPDLLDVLLVNESAWPEDAGAQDVLGLGLGVVLVTSVGRLERFRSLADLYALAFVPPASDPEVLWLALVGAFAGQRRQAQWQSQIARLQQRLTDRIIIERAKGILVQRLRISEEEAYQRLRVLSRRQRRQIREIAQSLLDTQCLFAPESNGCVSRRLDAPSLQQNLSYQEIHRLTQKEP